MQLWLGEICNSAEWLLAYFICHIRICKFKGSIKGVLKVNFLVIRTQCESLAQRRKYVEHVHDMVKNTTWLENIWGCYKKLQRPHCQFKNFNNFANNVKHVTTMSPSTPAFAVTSTLREANNDALISLHMVLKNKIKHPHIRSVNFIALHFSNFSLYYNISASHSFRSGCCSCPKRLPQAATMLKPLQYNKKQSLNTTDNKQNPNN